MTTEIESRSFEIRADAEDEFVLDGICAAYNTPADIGGQFMEQIAPGAFSRSLKTNADVCFLLNHNSDVVLGRISSGTLTLKDSPQGLRFHVQLDEENSQHRDVYRMIKRQDIKSCSFGFRVPDGGDVWEEVSQNGKRFSLRTLKDVELLEASCTPFPAYKTGTSVAARAAAAPTDDTSIDAYNRRRCAEIGHEIEADFQRRIEAAGRAVAEDRAKGDIS